MKCMENDERFIVSNEKLDVQKGIQIFHRKPLGAKFSAICCNASVKVMDNPSDQEHRDFLNERVFVGQSHHIVSTFLERSARILQD